MMREVTIVKKVPESDKECDSLRCGECFYDADAGTTCSAPNNFDDDGVDNT